MDTLHLVMVFHNHQPVGNFDHVFVQAYDQCYSLLLQLLWKHPRIRVGLHHSGPLLEWIEQNRPQYFKNINELVARGQIELVGGGFYEPMLSVLNDRDARGQLKMMNNYLAKYFGAEPNGMWLAERVWEPDLPRPIGDAGLKYTLLDDTHFFAAGLPEGTLGGYYLTEKAGKTLAIFPIDKLLRYLIPFHQSSEIIDYFKGLRGKYQGVTYGDDGEKFGVWPGTHKWVWQQGWLAEFFKVLEDNSEWLKMTLPTEYMQKFPASGRIYLPTASYQEMGEWALPAEAINRMEHFTASLEECNLLKGNRPFIKGGFWQNFLSKYSESNFIHKKMLRISDQLALAKTSVKEDDDTARKELKAAQKALFRGQCNCAYWHGLFGGIYLNYLRHALYHNLLLAARHLANINNPNDGVEHQVKISQTDLDCDGRDEILLEGDIFHLYLKPSTGASLCEISYLPALFNLTNIIKKRLEGYHNKIQQEEKPATQDEETVSIHDLVKFKEKGLERFLNYDKNERFCFLDHFYPAQTSLENLRFGKVDDSGDFIDSNYSLSGIQENEKDIEVRFKGQGQVGDIKGQIKKQYCFQRNKLAFKVKYSLTGFQMLDHFFTSEINLTLLAANAPDRYFVLNEEYEQHLLFDKPLEEDNCNSITLINEYDRFSVKLEFSCPCRLFYYPIETVSISEDGFERTFQGACFLPAFSLNQSGDTDLEIDFQVVSYQ